ncbi:MAG: PHP domain-containing protein [Clostridiales Family XIII bacterium]|jgi:putative hydrolase|nr:PHP domain-containing protein [Clostridiales Family XIII bacterium]
MIDPGIKTAYEVGGRRYTLLSDLHTHTTYSHGTGSIRENVEAARARGIMKIGIADHGPGHLFYGIKRRMYARMKADIEEVRAEYPDMEILLGVEANIEGGKGVIDVVPRDSEYFDFVGAGYHYGTLGGGTPFGLFKEAGNLISTASGRTAKAIIRSNTNSVVKAIEKNDILFLTHPGDKASVDLLEVAAACARRGTLVEINMKHRSLSADDIATMAIADIGFIVGSDAHSPDRIGHFTGAVDLICESGIDPERVVNIKVE